MSCQEKSDRAWRCSGSSCHGCGSSHSTGSRNLRYNVSAEPISHPQMLGMKLRQDRMQRRPSRTMSNLILLQLRLSNGSNLCYIHSFLLSRLCSTWFCPNVLNQVPDWIAEGLRPILHQTRLQALCPARMAHAFAGLEVPDPTRQHDAAEFAHYLLCYIYHIVLCGCIILSVLA